MEKNFSCLKPFKAFGRFLVFETADPLQRGVVVNFEEEAIYVPSDQYYSWIIKRGCPVEVCLEYAMVKIECWLDGEIKHQIALSHAKEAMKNLKSVLIERGMAFDMYKKDGLVVTDPNNSFIKITP